MLDLSGLIKPSPEFHAENMANFSKVHAAQNYLAGGGGGSETPVVSAQMLYRWNKLIAFSKEKGYAGKAELDHNAELRQKVFDEYNKANPNDAIPIDLVQPIQNEIQAYKQQALDSIKSGKGEFAGKPEDFMKGISQVDGIFGQLTSQVSIPNAYITDKATGERKNLGFAPKVALSSIK